MHTNITTHTPDADPLNDGFIQEEPHDQETQTATPITVAQHHQCMVT